jgi:hypothetical protein
MGRNWGLTDEEFDDILNEEEANFILSIEKTQQFVIERVVRRSH